MIVNNMLACCSINPDGSDGCHVLFASRECAAGLNGNRFDSALVHQVDAFTLDNESRTASWLFHPNHGMLWGE